MTAKEMFEKLGYEIVTNNSRRIKYADKDTRLDKEIEFNLIKKAFRKGDSDYFSYFITLKELKAINKQVEELGW